MCSYRPKKTQNKYFNNTHHYQKKKLISAAVFGSHLECFKILNDFSMFIPYI